MTSLMEDGKQPFAASVIEALARREAEIGLQWAERAPGVAAAGEVVRAVLAVIRDQRHSAEAATNVGHALGTAAHRRKVPLHQMLEDLDRLQVILLHAAERAAAEYVGIGGGLVAGQAGLSLAGCICGAVSSLRLAAAKGYTRAIEVELRERYRAIRHDLRNPLGTIKSAMALLSDESLPTEMHQSSRVRAMVARNARSLEQMIGEALSDDAASLPALGNAGDSARKQRDDLLRARQRPDLEPGAL